MPFLQDYLQPCDVIIGVFEAIKIQNKHAN